MAASPLKMINSDQNVQFIDDDEGLTLKKCNEYTQEFRDNANDRTIYVFDYKGLPVNLNRITLKKLKDKNRWDIIKHPLVLNYINEILVASALTYAIHILIYFVFLFLLYSYIHTDPQTWNNSIVTLLVSFFIFTLLVKAKLKTERDPCNRISTWFCVSYVFTFLTYAVTLFFIWSPIIFNFDNYNLELKRTISWFLPIIAIISSWIQCLYILRKSPCGPYILMMSKILRSFLGTIFIWVPTLLCFAFSFQLVMRESGKDPWNDQILANSSSVFMTMFQSFTKTSAMMIGEVEANDILELRAWIANLLLIVFEVITVILLMNLMISLAVGDVSELRKYSDIELLKIKVNYCIEALHLSEFTACCPWTPLFKQKINNIAVIYKHENQIFTLFKELGNRLTFPTNIVEKPQIHDLTLNAESIRLIFSNIAPGSTLDRLHVLGVENAIIRVKEVPGSGISPITNEGFKNELSFLKDEESCFKKFQRWLIGLNWNSLYKAD
uniref:Ion transport domain-containing protein n=1 Tax=Panagrolaimus sp. JU765 TaxID=591449 RepID=A0AC34QIC0_9BILA